MAPTPFDDLPVYLRPRLKLFLSADLVGSTAFKQSPRFPLEIDSEESDTPPGPHWLNSITNFYSDFGAEFARQWKIFGEGAKDDPKWPMGQAPEFWKGIGDEVVYVKDLSDPKEVAGTIWIWMLAMRKYRSVLKSKHPALDIKATAWIGGFPINNSEVVFDLELASQELPDDARLGHFQKLEEFYGSAADHTAANRTKYVRDFIGTSVDTGFRLATKSTPRRMSASIEVVLMIASTPPAEEKYGPISIYFEGYEAFKGVLGGKPYPVFWIDLFQGTDAEALAQDEDKLLHRDPSDEGKLLKFCEHFIAANSQYLIRPFIVGCNDTRFTKLPKNYAEKLAEWNRKIKKEQERYLTETKFDEAPPTPTSTKKAVKEGDLEKVLNEWLSRSAVVGVRVLKDVKKEKPATAGKKAARRTRHKRKR